MLEWKVKISRDEDWIMFSIKIKSLEISVSVLDCRLFWINLLSSAAEWRYKYIPISCRRSLCPWCCDLSPTTFPRMCFRLLWFRRYLSFATIRWSERRRLWILTKPGRIQSRWGIRGQKSPSRVQWCRWGSWEARLSASCLEQSDKSGAMQ